MFEDRETKLAFGDVKESLKAGLRHLARSVAIISCSDGRRNYAITATAVSELSLDPPSMLVCINRSASIHQPLDGGAAFCINILSRSQEAISALCGGKAPVEERFRHEDWRTSRDGVPFLANANAVFQCTQRHCLSYGTHDVFVGEVMGVAISARSDPLIYANGRYASLSWPDAAVAPA